jgi:hypothetical protein
MPGNSSDLFLESNSRNPAVIPSEPRSPFSFVQNGASAEETLKINLELFLMGPEPRGQKRQVWSAACQAC